MINKYLEKRIKWFQEEKGGITFSAVVDDVNCKLRMNDFPVEPMYTLFVFEEELSFDNKPDLWEIVYIE